MRDVFLSHASPDKRSIVLPVAEALRENGITFWLDEAEIRWGDKISIRINDGLATARFVIVFLTPSFLDRNWPQTELSAALSRENVEGRTVVLPIVVEPKAVLGRFPLLSDKFYLEWTGTTDEIVAKLREVLEHSLREARSAIRVLSEDRIRGRRKIYAHLSNALGDPSIEEFVRLELAIHEFSRLGALKSRDFIGHLIERQSMSGFVTRGLLVLSALGWISKGNLNAAREDMENAVQISISTLIQQQYCAAQEGFAHLALGNRQAADGAWQPLSRADEESLDYPFRSGRDFGKALIGVLASQNNVTEIVGRLPIEEHRGTAHFAAQTARIARLSRSILIAVENWGVQENWKARPTTQIVAGRLHSFEKEVLSRAGSLYG